MAGPSYPQRRHPRLAGYDYQTPGYYFITVCVEARLPLFGRIENGIMHRTPAGDMVVQTWTDVAAQHPGVALDTIMVMPDHLHAIVVLEDDPRRNLSLSDMVHRCKSLAVKRYAQGVRDHGWPRFSRRLWQESFHDRVIRKDEDLDEIRRYIVHNAERWEPRRQAAAEAGG